MDPNHQIELLINEKLKLVEQLLSEEEKSHSYIKKLNEKSIELDKINK
jgi:hypothetical protein